MDPLSFDNEQVPISPVSIDYLIKNEIQNDENITERNIEYIDTEIVEQNIIDSLNSDGEFDSTEIDIMDFGNYYQLILNICCQRNLDNKTIFVVIHRCNFCRSRKIRASRTS